MLLFNIFSVGFFDKYCLYTQEQLAWYQAIFDDVSDFNYVLKLSQYLKVSIFLIACINFVDPGLECFR